MKPFPHGKTHANPTPAADEQIFLIFRQPDRQQRQQDHPPLRQWRSGQTLTGASASRPLLIASATAAAVRAATAGNCLPVPRSSGFVTSAEKARQVANFVPMKMPARTARWTVCADSPRAGSRSPGDRSSKSAEESAALHGDVGGHQVFTLTLPGLTPTPKVSWVTFAHKPTGVVSDLPGDAARDQCEPE